MQVDTVHPTHVDRARRSHIAGRKMYGKSHGGKPPDAGKARTGAYQMPVPPPVALLVKISEDQRCQVDSVQRKVESGQIGAKSFSLRFVRGGSTCDVSLAAGDIRGVE